MNLLQLVYDFLFPLPPVCPICLKRRPDCKFVRNAGQRHYKNGVCMDSVSVVTALVFAVHNAALAGTGPLIWQEILPFGPISRIGSRSYWISNFAINLGWQRYWQKNWRRCCRMIMTYWYLCRCTPNDCGSAAIIKALCWPAGCRQKAGFPSGIVCVGCGTHPTKQA